MSILKDLLVWLHVMGMVGALGSMVVVQFGLPRDIRDSAAGARVGPRVTSWLMALGLLAGFVLTGWWVVTMRRAGVPLSAHYLGTVGLKFILMLVAAGSIGVSSAKLRAGLVRTASRLRLTAIAALALAALLGVTLHHAGSL